MIKKSQPRLFLFELSPTYKFIGYYWSSNSFICVFSVKKSLPPDINNPCVLAKNNSFLTISGEALG